MHIPNTLIIRIAKNNKNAVFLKDNYPLKAHSGLTRPFTATALCDASLGKNQKAISPPISNNDLKPDASFEKLL